MRFIGTGAEEKALKKLGRKLDVPVEFLDSIPFAQIPQHYEWAHTILVHLQDWTAFEYTVPSKLYEALELGRHITLAAAGESAHIVSVSRSGDCVTPNGSTGFSRISGKALTPIDRDLLSTEVALSGSRPQEPPKKTRNVSMNSFTRW